MNRHNKEMGAGTPYPDTDMNTVSSRNRSNTGKNKKANSTPKQAPSKVGIAKPAALTESEYQKHMARIEALMLKGSEHLTEAELIELRTLSLLAQGYEQQHYALEPPTTFAGLLERKMYELKLRQGELARRLHVSPAKLSLVISGKQKPDVALIKAAYSELQVDGNLLLRVL